VVVLYRVELWVGKDSELVMVNAPVEWSFL
jgi:hypothetical protein